jgi:hypothetical protein
MDGTQTIILSPTLGIRTTIGHALGLQDHLLRDLTISPILVWGCHIAVTGVGSREYKLAVELPIQHTCRRNIHIILLLVQGRHDTF